jgi:Zn-dependent protease with chaperone function
MWFTGLSSHLKVGRRPASVPHKSDAARVRDIGEALLARIGVRPASLRVWPRRVVLVRSGRSNAYCRSDGTIVINTGLLDNLRLTNDELAFVIGHEMAHAIRQHGRTQLGRNILVGLGSVLTRLLFGRRSAELASLLGNLNSLRLGRSDEKEADLLGMRIAADAGFDPKAALTLWKKAEQLGPPGAPMADRPPGRHPTSSVPSSKYAIHPGVWAQLNAPMCQGGRPVILTWAKSAEVGSAPYHRPAVTLTLSCSSTDQPTPPLPTSTT